MNDSIIEINTSILKDNIKTILKKYDDYKYYIGVVKGNAYGHGFEIVKYMEKSGINYFAVSNLKEALTVRKYTDLPILCLQPIDIDDIKLASDNDITLTLSNYEYYKKLLNTNYKLKVHLKIDSGMNRLGINNKKEIEEIFNNLIDNKNILLEGIYTHLATLGINDKKWDNQIEKFKYLISNVDINKVKVIHLYSTNSIVFHPKLEIANGIRIGMLMYGVCPRKINYSGIKGLIRKYKNKILVKKYNISKINENYCLNVKPCLELSSKVVEIKKVLKDEYVGYGLNYKMPYTSNVAVVPIGYADGLSLKNSGRFVSINSKKYKIIGTVNMRMITILVGDNVKVNDKCVLLDENVRCVCNYTHTTPQNLYTTLSSDIKRIYK